MEEKILLRSGALQILCKHSAPEDGDIRRIVLGVHGLGGSTEDQIQKGIAEEMEMYYAATFRFDFPAHGESPLDSSFLNLRSCMDSLMAVAEYAREKYPQVEDLCIFATGFGAYITLVTLQELRELPGKVKLVVQTPSVQMHQSVLNMTHTSRPTLKAMDSVTFNSRRPFTVSYQFYKEMEDHVALATYPIPMLILHGEEDDFIPMEDIQHLHRLNDQSELVIIPGASHRFLEEGAWDMVLDLTRDWFEFEQVLLM